MSKECSICSKIIGNLIHVHVNFSCLYFNLSSLLHWFFFHTVHGILKAKILKWFAILISGPHFVRTLHHDPSIFGGPTWHGFIVS